MTSSPGLRLEPFRALRPDVDADRLGRLLCPPYDVIGEDDKRRMLAVDPANAVSLVLPDPSGIQDRYDHAAQLLRERAEAGLYRRDDVPGLYVYEMSDPHGTRTRGLLGAVELRAPEDGVILPHEDTMAGPVADRLALMSATHANLEPIYLVYDGGGDASEVVAQADRTPTIASATTTDGITHRLWQISDATRLGRVREDLRRRTALIADGHHRYATYRRLQAGMRAEHGPGPWDFGLTLLVDGSAFGPQVHAIHRTVPATTLADALDRLQPYGRVEPVDSPTSGLDRAAAEPGFAVVLSDGDRHVLFHDADGLLQRAGAAAASSGEPPELGALDVSIVHRGLIASALGREDSVDAVHYAHSVEEALTDAAAAAGIALLLRPTPLPAVAAVARARARMPRKSTLFTPKPASGLVLRRFADER